MMNNKRGSMEDTFWVIAVLFGFAIFFIILAYTFSQVQPRLSDAIEDKMPDDGVNMTRTLEQTHTATIRYNTFFPLILIGLFSFVLISAFFLNSHPIFFWIGLLLLGIALIFAAIFSNVYHQIAENDQLATTTDDFPIVDVFMENLPIFVLIVFVTIGIVLWTKFGGSSSGSGL